MGTKTFVLKTVSVIAAILLSNIATAEEAGSAQFGQDLSRLIVEWESSNDQAKTLDCAESYVATVRDKATGVGPCVRLVTKTIEDQGDRGNFHFVIDFRVLKVGDHHYGVAWSQLEAISYVYLEVESPPAMLQHFYPDHAKAMTDWTEPKTYSAGLTRQYRGAKSKYKNGMQCLSLTSKRGKSATALVFTCGYTLPDKKMIKAALKTLR